MSFDIFHMHECTYIISEVSGSEGGPSSSTGSNQTSGDQARNLTSNKSPDQTKNFDDNKIHLSNAGTPPCNSSNTSKIQENTKSESELATKLGKINTCTRQPPQLTSSPNMDVPGATLSRAPCSTANMTRNRNIPSSRTRPLNRACPVPEKDQSQNDQTLHTATLKKMGPQEVPNEKNGALDALLRLESNRLPPSSGVDNATPDTLEACQGPGGRHGPKPWLPPVTAPYIRRQYLALGCNSVKLAPGSLSTSIEDKSKNGKDNSCSEKPLKGVVGPERAFGSNGSLASGSSPLNSQRARVISPIETASHTSGLKSKRQKNAISKRANEANTFVQSATGDGLSPSEPGQSTRNGDFTACISEAHRLYRNILANRPKSPLSFIIDALQQQLGHGKEYPTSTSKTPSAGGRGSHREEIQARAGAEIGVELQPCLADRVRLTCDRGAEVEEKIAVRNHTSDMLSMHKGMTSLALTQSDGERKNFTISELAMEKVKACDNSEPSLRLAFQKSMDYVACHKGDRNLSESVCASCDTTSQKASAGLVCSDRHEEHDLALTGSTKQCQGHAGGIVCISTESTSVGMHSSGPHMSWSVATLAHSNSTNIASPQFNCTAPLSQSNLTQRNFNPLTRVNLPSGTTSTSMPPVLTKKSSLTGSTLAAGSTLDFRSSGSDISSVFSAAPVDIQEMLRELRLAKETEIGAAQSHVTWNELVSILENASFPVHDATVLADLFDELWLSEQNRERRFAAEREVVVSNYSSPMTPPTTGFGNTVRKRYCIGSPSEGKPPLSHSFEGVDKLSFQRTQIVFGMPQGHVIEAMKGTASLEQEAAPFKRPESRLPIPSIRFETFLASMAYKIQGRYPVEIIRQAFFELADEYGAKNKDSSDKVSYKLGLALECAPNCRMSTKDPEDHLQKGTYATSTRNKNNQPTPSCPHLHRTEEAHQAPSNCNIGIAPDTPLTLDLTSITDTSFENSSEGQGKESSSEMPRSVFQEETKEGFSPLTCMSGAISSKDHPQQTSNVANHIDLMTSISGFSRLFSPHMTNMSQTVSLQVCVLEGIQGLLGLNNFDGADVDQALTMAGQPLHNLDRHLHLDEFIRLVHCMTMLINRKLISATHHTKGGNFLYPALTRSGPGTTASGGAAYNCSNNTLNSISRGENEANSIV